MDELDDDTPISRPLTFEDVKLAVRTAAAAYGSQQFTLVGRGSLAASMPDSAESLRATIDIDLFPPWKPEQALPWAVADTKIGRYSVFQDQHGFYVERVGEWTLLNQPHGWEDRALKFEIDGVHVVVIHPLDLAYNKLEAGRRKDIDFMREGLSSGAYNLAEVESFIREHAPDDATRDLILANLTQALCC